MIHLVTEANRHLYRAELQALHALRRCHFIEERGWALTERDGGEYDAYDDDLARYLIGFGPEREIEVACRIRSTEHGGLIPDHFAHLIGDHEPPPRAAGAYECTRYFAVAAARGRRGFVARSRLHVAMVEHVQDLGGERLLGFVDLPFLAHLRRFSGLRIRPVGLPSPYEDGDTIAFEIGVTAQDLAETRRRLQLPGRQLFIAPPWLPAGADIFALENSVRLLLSAPGPDRSRLDARVRALADRFAAPADPDAVLEALARAA